MNSKKNTLVLACIYFIVLIFFSVHLTTYYINKSAVAAFKKLYSVYSQALMITVADMDGDTGCYYSSDKRIPSKSEGCRLFYKTFATNLKVVKFCKDESLSKGCLPLYKNYAKTPSCAGFSESMMNRYNQTFVMSDKSSLTVFNLPATKLNPMFAVDSNGMLRPNKVGYDLFSLVIMRSANGNYYFHPNVTYCLPLEKGGIHNLKYVYK